MISRVWRVAKYLAILLVALPVTLVVVLFHALQKGFLAFIVLFGQDLRRVNWYVQEGWRRALSGNTTSGRPDAQDPEKNVSA